MKKQYKAPEIEVLLFDFREIAMTDIQDTGVKDTVFNENNYDPWTDPTDVIENNLNSIDEVNIQ